MAVEARVATTVNADGLKLAAHAHVPTLADNRASGIGNYSREVPALSGAEPRELQASSIGTGSTPSPNSTSPQITFEWCSQHGLNIATSEYVWCVLPQLTLDRGQFTHHNCPVQEP